MSFERNVFINCPFDDDYFPILKPLLFTVIYLGLNPRISLESSDSGEVRVDKLMKLIQESKYAIHDLSRLQATKAGEMARLNMPFELGLDIACRKFGAGKLKEKKGLILEKDRYEYQKALSDIAGQDISAHQNDPQSAMTKCLEWLISQCKLKGIGTTRVWQDLLIFRGALEVTLKDSHTLKEIEGLPINQYIAYAKDWVEHNPRT